MHAVERRDIGLRSYSYICCGTALSYLADDGYGPLNQRSAAKLDDFERIPTALRKTLDLELAPEEDVPLPDLVLPQASNSILVAHALFKEHLSDSLQVFGEASLKIREGSSAPFHVSQPRFSQITFDVWAAIDETVFQSIRAVSLKENGELKIVDPEIRYSFEKEHREALAASSVLRPILPKTIHSNLPSAPSLFEFGGCIFLRDDIVRKFERGHICGLAPNNLSCELFTVS